MIDWYDMVYGEIFVGAAALAGVVIAIENVLTDCDRDFAAWSFVGFHGKSKLMCV